MVLMQRDDDDDDDDDVLSLLTPHRERLAGKVQLCQRSN